MVKSQLKSHNKRLEIMNKQLLDNLDNQVKKICLGIELIVTPAVMLIQSCFRRYLIRKKINSWLEYFNYLREIEVKKSENFIAK